MNELTISQPDASQTQLELSELREKVVRLETALRQVTEALGFYQQRLAEQVPPQFSPKPVVTTTRRKALRKLAAGLVTGVSLAAVVTGNRTGTAQAYVAVNPSSNIGAIIMPKGGSFSGSPLNAANHYGLIASSNPTLDLSILDSNLSSNAVVGITTTVYGNGVFGQSASEGACGVFGENIGNGKGFGVGGFSTTATGIGVWGDSSTNLGSDDLSHPFPSGVIGTCPTGYGVVGKGGLAPLYLMPGSSQGAPSTGTHRAGEFYVDSSGALFYCYSGDGTTVGSWKQLAP